MRSPLIATAVAGALIGFSPAAHAGPYSDPYCDPSSRSYNSRMCSDEYQNDEECSEFGDTDRCQQDYQDFWRQQRQLTPTPN